MADQTDYNMESNLNNNEEEYPGLGIDIKLNNYGQFVINAKGDLALCASEICLLQGIRHRLLTPLKDLFYDQLFGLDYYKYLHRSNTEDLQYEFCEEVKEHLRLEPRIRQGTEDCKLLSWDDNLISFEISFVHIEGTTPKNLVLNANLQDLTLVVKGVSNG